ncbi:DUF885 family protein [Tundrisphaera lichenicola]|uniref:DUF885 family protein n=1 Tax=Tundrisphaera lichenicola TaxID=2029860 RepID=UPI003EBEEBBF
MRPLIERFSNDRRSLDRSIPAIWSQSRQKRLEAFQREWIALIEKLDFESMSRDGRIDYLLLRNELDHGLRQLELESRRMREIDCLVPYAETIVTLEESRRKMEAIDPPAIADLLNELTQRIRLSTKDLEASNPEERKKNSEVENSAKSGSISRSLALRTAGFIDDLDRTLERWFGFYKGYDPSFSWWATEPYKTVQKSLSDHAAMFREKIAGIKPGESSDGGEIVGDPVGREALLADLESEMIPYTPEELAAIAEKELAWCEVEKRKASNDLGFGDDWQRALEHVKKKFVEPGKQPDLIRDLARESVDFLEERDLVTIPPLVKETWRMEMMSPARQLVNPFFTGGEVISVSFPTDAMNHEQKLMSLRGNNIHFSKATVHHELIPGHHLQGFMSTRHRSYRREFSTPFSIEGWALYWELRLWDLNFARSPEDRLGMLFWRSHRCARILFSLNFHLGKMSPEECVDLLVNRIGHERANAEGEVRRSFEGSYSPLYQAAYLLGGLQLRALHGELVKTAKMTEKAFHDAVLRENQIPAAMIRASLTEIDLDREGTAATWKFYEVEPLKP